MQLHTQAVLMVGGDLDALKHVGNCVAGVSGCRFLHVEKLTQAAEVLLHRESLGMLLVCVQNEDQAHLVHELHQLLQTVLPGTPLVVLADAEAAVQKSRFLSDGAADCLSRPFNLSRLTFLIDFLTLRGRTLRTASIATRALAAPTTVEPQQVAAAGMTYESPEDKALVARAARLAQVDTTVLLNGETGSGKTVLARLIHSLSPRRSRPFVVVNCGALPETLVESELFGHRQGAFTGADREQVGKFSQAQDGTLFLDEVDSLSLAAQSKLLRVVEERVFEPLGSGKSQRLVARLLFATNRDLKSEVQAGRFRQDLYYRLNVVTLALPPLRDRAVGIPTLVGSFLRDLRGRGMTRVREFSREALASLQAYAWPGNIRELRNLVEQLAVLTESETIQMHHLPAEIRSPEPAAGLTARAAGSARSLAESRASAERSRIVQTLEICDHNRSRAAESLGISRAAFYKKLHRFQLLPATG